MNHDQHLQNRRIGYKGFRRLCALLLLTLPVALPALAATDDHMDLAKTSDLVAICSAPDENHAAHAACTAFIKATGQYHDAITDHKNLKPLACYPSTATVEDGRLAFLKWASANRRNKKMMNELPVVGLVRSWAAAYPCS